uniref:Uncharacterized protein n=1 Tax=Solanum lycopersicum TaxID=4081 RepID=A0A3Q7HLB3_SOLLC
MATELPPSCSTIAAVGARIDGGGDGGCWFMEFYGLWQNMIMKVPLVLFVFLLYTWHPKNRKSSRWFLMADHIE